MNRQPRTDNRDTKAEACALVLERAARVLLVALLFAAPLLLGYPRPGGYHWLDKLSPLLVEYEFPLMLSHLWVCLVALLVLVAAGLRGEIGARLGLIGLGAVAFLVATGLATLRSVSPHASLIELTRVFDAVAVYFLVRRLCATQNHRLVFLAALVAGGFAAAAQGLRHYVFTAARLHDTTWREFGPFGNPNSFAGFLLLVLPLGLALFLATGRRIWRLVAGFVVLLMLGALFVTGSKGGLLAFLLAAAAFVLIVACPWARGSRRRTVALVAVCLLPIVLGFLLPQVRDRFVAAFTTESHSGAFRLYTWLATWKMFLARPWLGWGPGSFADLFPRFAIAGFTRLAHNKDLQIAAEGGVLSLIPLAFVFIGYLVLSLRPALHGKSVAERAIPAALFAGILGFCLHSLVDYDWYVPAICLTVWAIMALETRPETLRSRARKRREKASDAPAVKAPENVPQTASKGLQVAFLGLVVSVFGALMAFGAVELAATTHLHRAAHLARRGDPSAPAELRRAAALSPLNPEPHFELGLVHEQWGQAFGSPQELWEARREFGRLSELEPRAARAYAHLSYVEALLGDTGRSIRLAEQALERAPRDPKLIVQLARLYAAAGQAGRAEAMFHRLHGLWESPAAKYRAIEGMVEWRYAYAWAYFHQQAKARGDEEGADKWRRQALDLLDEYESYMQKQSEMLKATGRWPPPDLEEARALRRALAGAGGVGG
ncbi:MAG: O-antigen ligase family protein [Armatimonadota bacterium]